MKKMLSLLKLRFYVIVLLVGICKIDFGYVLVFIIM